MPRISTDNYDTVASWNGSQDLFVVEQPDGTKVATPAMVKQFIEAGNFTATGEVKDGHGNILADMAKADEVKGLAEAGDFEATGEVKDGHGNILSAVVDQVSQLDAEIAKQSVTVTRTSAVTSNSGILAYICNNFCFVTMDANILSGAVDGTVLATGFTKPISFAAIGRTTSSFDIMINSSGELIIKGTPTTGWVQGSISYMI